MYTKLEFLAFYNQFQVTFGQMTSLPGHFQSRDIIFCRVTATSCELQPCRCSNVHKTRVFGLQQQLPGDFR